MGTGDVFKKTQDCSKDPSIFDWKRIELQNSYFSSFHFVSYKFQKPFFLLGIYDIRSDRFGLLYLVQEEQILWKKSEINAKRWK